MYLGLIVWFIVSIFSWVHMIQEKKLNVFLFIISLPFILFLSFVSMILYFTQYLMGEHNK